ncbi:DUF4231 domain-containing protein [Actinomadura graeca]|uniref:DUF4231 domain-containing protein n=1 Tax=Actinomadura graeca TaxID=2750812 RepID=A0ABX8QR87_9ACTN|nr:DUF4231 domain-containing protein [Actinomadura graeca]QXJ21310.1 DUF4231 domain-containing protein [Actinomadura graeca]
MRIPRSPGPPKFQPPPVTPEAAFPASVEAYALKIRDFYDHRARWHRRFFRVTSILVILIGAALPLAAGLQYEGKSLTLALAGVTISVLTALRSFYHWDQLWVMLRNTEIVVHDAYVTWKRKDADFARSSAPDAAALRDQAAQELMTLLLEVRRGEAETFFRALLNSQQAARGST